MLADKNDKIGSGYLPILKEAGYDYVEMPLAEIMELSEKEFSELTKKVEAVKLPCMCCNNFFPPAIRLTGPHIDWDLIEGYVKKSISRAVNLRAETIVFGSGKAKNIPAGFPYEEAFKQVADLLRMIDGYTASRQIKVVLEPLNREESNLILNLREAGELMRYADCQSVYQLVDYYHFVKEEDSYLELKEAIEKIRHVHFAEPKGRVFPIDKQEEYGKFFGFLKENGYEGTISIEAYSKNPLQEIQKACFIKEYF